MALLGCMDERERVLKTARVDERVHPLTRLAASQAEDKWKDQDRTEEHSCGQELKEQEKKEHLALVFGKCS